MTDAEYLAWLKSPNAYRIILVEAIAQVNGVETTRYMSNLGFTTSISDVPANTHYAPVVSTGFQFTEQLSLTGLAGLSLGDLEIQSIAGARESWMADVWMNRDVRIWIGDVRWARADFRLIFNGVNAGIVRKDERTLALKLRDKTQRLNSPMTEHKLGGTSPNKDAIIPLCFGECHNITPLLIDANLLKYQVHDGAVESIFEVRDNGVPVVASVDNATGTFTLALPPVGAITCSVQGDKFGGIYRNTVAALIKRIVTGFGKASTRFTVADLDVASFDAFEATHSQPVNLFISDRTNVLVACEMLANSLGAQIVQSRAGLLRIIQLALPAAGAPSLLLEQHIVVDTLEPGLTINPVAAVKLGYCRNWTPQTGLQTPIPALHRDLYEKDWLSTTQTDETTRAAYKLEIDPSQQDTMLVRLVDADPESLRRLQMWKVPRTPYECDAVPEMLGLELGQALTVFHRRFSMANGVPAVVTSLTPDWDSGRVKVGFLV